MSSTLTTRSSVGEEYSKYSAFEEGGATIGGDSISFAIQSKAAAGSLSLADVKFGDQVQSTSSNHQHEYSRDEILYALSSPSSIGAMAWILSSFMAVLYGSSIVVYLNFCIPLFLGPYVIREQMPAQLLPAIEKKYIQVRGEANVLEAKNVQLKGTVSRMQRQEYRLSAAEERFEHLCRRSEKDIVKMKQLARKNAALRQKIKMNLAGKKLQKLLTNIKLVDRENKIDEVVELVKEFSGKNTSSKFDKDVIRGAVVNSIAKNNVKTTFTSKPKPNIESDAETRDSEGDYGRLKMHNARHMPIKEDETEESYSHIIGKPSLQSSEGNEKSLKLDPSGHLSENPHNKEDFSVTQRSVARSVASGTADRPIDIEKFLKKKESLRHHYSSSRKQAMMSPIE